MRSMATGVVVVSLIALSRLTTTARVASTARIAVFAREPGPSPCGRVDVIAEVSVLTARADPYHARVTMNSARRPGRLLRPLRHGAMLVGLLFTAYLFVVVAPSAGTLGFDAYAYWSIDPADPYATGVGGLGAFNYTPPLARLFQAFGVLDWLTFLWLWLALMVGTVIWLGDRSSRVLWLLAFPPVALELYHGNVHLFIAAAIALGFRYPWTWAFVILTKVTPGVGLVWFLVRREWRSLAIGLGATAAIVAVSVVVDRPLWESWIGLLQTTPDGGSVAQVHIPIPLWLRIPASIALVAWGGLTDRRWTVPLAAACALPVLWISGFAICAAMVRIEQDRRR